MVFYLADLHDLSRLGAKVYSSNIVPKLKILHNFHELDIPYFQEGLQRKFKTRVTIFYQILAEQTYAIAVFDFSSVKNKHEVYKLVMNHLDLEDTINLKSSTEILDKYLLINRFSKFLRRIMFFKHGMYLKPILKKQSGAKKNLFTVVQNQVTTR